MSNETKINERSWIPLGAAITIGLGAFSGGWMIKSAISQMDSRIAAIEAERWSVSDMERFGYLLERNNRQLPLWVPDPREVKSLHSRNDIKPTPPKS